MQRAGAAQHASSGLVWAALFVVYVVWGSTYLAIAITVETIPPLLAGCARFLSAGLLMALVIAVRAAGPRSSSVANS